MARPIPNDFVQQLLTSVDIVNVVNSRVPLTPAGREFKACCPFHSEKTPSFYVSPAKQFYHCFGCGESGTAISFLMKYGNYRFIDAVEELAASVGLKVPREYADSPQHGGYTQLLELMAKVNSEYQRQLYKSQDTAEARMYLKDRGITFDAAQDFGLGYAPNEWDFVLNKFGRSEASRKQLLEAGLIISKEDNKQYDRFRGRLMFPIEDRRGRVIAFGGRVIGEGEPKYLNSPETILFKKGNELFGLKKALPAIKSEERVLVVEGYTDVVVLAQFGVENVVATLGTAMTAFHVKELFRTIHEVVLCFDGDEAGSRAAWRAVEAILPNMEDGHLVSFVFLPQGQDPDSMIREEGTEAFKERMLNGEPITDFIFRVLLEQSDITRTDGRAKFAAEFGKVISKLQHSLLRQMMLSELSTRTGLSETAIRSVLKPPRSEQNISKSTPNVNDASTLTGRLTTFLVQNPDWGEFVFELEDLDALQDPSTKLLTEILRYLQREPDLTTAGLVEKFRSTEYFNIVQKFASVKLDSNEELQHDLKQEFFGVLSRLQEQVVKQSNKLLLNKPGKDYDQVELQDALQRLKDNYVLRKHDQEGRTVQ